MAQSNDLTGLGTIKTDGNQITDVNISQGENTNINFGYAPNKTQQQKINQQIKTKLEEDSDKTRAIALEETIAGIPTIDSPTLTLTQKAPDITKVSSASSFTTRDEVMSRLNMLDETFNYTDTYTNYINQGGTPVPGYEWAHTELLEQERKEAIFKQAEEGSISFDNALMEAYGKDILATMNMDVTSVGFWKQKYAQSDYSNPFANQVLMGQVKAAALEQYNTDIMKNAQNKQANQFSQASGLVGDELTGKQIKDIFGDIGTLAEEQNMSDQEVRNACLSGQIAATSRILWKDQQQSEGYYLHTDGQLYHITAENIRKNSEGQITDISLNGSEFFDFGRHFVAGVSSVFTGLYKLGGVLLVGAGSLIFDTTDTTENIVNFLNNTDAAINDFELTNWLTDTGHVDMDGFQISDVSDWSMLLADVGGTIVGGMGLASAGSALVGAGGKLASSSSKLVQFGGKALQFTGNLAARSTGMYAGAKDVNLNTFRFLGAVKQGGWAPFANHALKTCTTYAVKDYYTTSQQLANQIWQAKVANGEEMTAEDFDKVGARAGLITAGNYLVSIVFAGGINDNQLQRLGYTKETKALGQIVDDIGDSKVVKEITRGMTANKKLSTELLDKVSDESLKSYLTARRVRIAFNTGFDFVDNFVTMSTSDIFGQVDKDGNIIGFTESLQEDPETGKKLWATYLLKNLVQATIMTGPTLKGNFETNDYNVAIATLKNSFQEFNTMIDNKIKSAKSPEDIQTLTLLKQDIMGVYNSTKGSAEEKIIATFDHAHSMLKDENGDSIITKAMTNAVSAKKIEFYRALYDDAYNKATIINAIKDKYYSDAMSKDRGTIRNIATFIPRTVLKNWIGIEDGTIKSSFNSTSFVDPEALSNRFTADMNKEYATFGEVFDAITGSVKSSEALDKITDPSAITNLTNSVEFIDPFKVNKLNELPVPEGEKRKEFLANNRLIRIKNEASLQGGTLNDRLKASIMKTTLDLMAEDTGGSLVSKINEEYYAMPNSLNTLSKAFTEDTIFKLNAGLANIAQGRTEGIEVLITTMLGDEHFKTAKNKDDKAARALDTILSKAIENNVLDEGQVVTLMDNLLVKEDLDESVKGAVEAFRTMVTNVTESKYDSMTTSEKYYYTFKAAQDILKDYDENPNAIKSNKISTLINMFVDITDENNPVIKADMMNMLTTLVNNKKLSTDQLKILLEICEKGLKSVPQLSEAVNRLFSTVSQITNGAKMSEEQYFDLLLGTKYEDKIKDLKKKIARKDAAYNKLDKRDQKRNSIALQKAMLEIQLDEEILVYNKIREDLKQTYKLMVELGNKTKDKDLGDNIVVLNGAKLYNENLKELANKERKSTKDEKAFSISKNVDSILEKHSEIFSSQIRVFDLNDANDIEKLRNILIDLEIVTRDTKLDTAADIKRAIALIDDDDIIHSSGRQSIIKGLEVLNNSATAKKVLENIKNLKMKRFLVNPTTGEKVPLNAYTVIKNHIDLTDLSDEMLGTLKDSEDIKIYPIARLKESDLIDSPEKFAYVRTETNEQGEKIGTLGGAAASKNVPEFKQTIAKGVASDHDLSVKFALLQLVDTLADDSNGLYSFIIPSENIDDNLLEFYTVHNLNEGKSLLVFNKAKADDAKKYIISNKEINLFKLIPVLTDGHSTNTENYIKQFPIREYNGAEIFEPDVFDDNAGLHQGLDTLLNIRFSWDVDNSIKNEIFLGLFAKANEGDYNYNVFSKKNKPTEFEGSYNEYTQNILSKKVRDSKHPVGQLLSIYKNNLSVLLKGTGEGDYNVWLLEPAVAKYIELVYKEKGLDGVKSLTPENIKEIYKYSLPIKKSILVDEGTSVINTPVIVNKGDLDAAPVSGDIMVEASGRRFQLVDIETGKFLIDEHKVDADITKALDTVVALLQDYENDILPSNNKYITMYRDSEDMNFAASVAGHNGYITIEDLDYIIDMEFSFFKRLYDGTSVSQAAIRADFERLKNLAHKTLEVETRKARAASLYVQAKSSSGTSATLESGKMVVDTSDLSNAENIETAKLLMKMDRNKRRYEKDTTRRKRLTDFNLRDLDVIERDQLEALDNKISTHYLSTGDREVLNLQNNIGKFAQQRIIENTAASIKTMANSLDTVIADDKLFPLAKDLMDRVGGNKGESIGYVIIDKEGNIIDDIPKSYNNQLEVHSKLSKLDNLEGKIFLSLENHDLKSNDGIKFSYVTLDSEKAVQDLRTAFLEDGISAAYKVRDKKIHGNKSFEEYMTYLKNIPEEELVAVLNNAERMQMSRKANNQFIVDVVAALTNQKDIDKVAETIIEKKLGNPFYADNSKKNYLNRKSNDLRSDNYYEREQASLAIFGQSYDLLGTKEKEAAKIISDYFTYKHKNATAIQYGELLANNDIDSKEFKDLIISYWNTLKGDNEEFSLSYKDAKELIQTYLAKSKTAQAFSYITNMNLKLQTLSEAPETYNKLTFSDWSDSTKVTAKTLKDVLDGTIKHRTHLIDIEGLRTSGEAKPSSITEAFQLAIKTFNGEGESITKTYFIKHSDLSPDELDKKYEITTSAFYKENKGYRNAWEEYKKAYDSQSDYLIDEKDVYKLFNTDDYILAFNGFNYDFRLLKDALEAKGINVKYFDVINIASALDENAVTHKMSQEALAAKYLKDFEKHENAHNAFDDVNVMEDLTKVLLDNCINFDMDGKKTILKDVNTIAKLLNITDEELPQLYKDLDATFKDKVPDYIKVHQQKFKQEFMDTSDTFKILRLLNFLERNGIGSVVRDFETTEMYKQLGVDQMTKDFINGGADNIVTALAHLRVANKGMTAADAFNTLIRIGYDDLDDNTKSTKSMIQVLNSKDILNKLPDNVDYSSEEFKTMKSSIENNLRKNIFTGILDKENGLGLDAEDVRNWKKTGNIDTAMRGMHKAIRGLNLDDNIKELAIRNMLTPTTSSNGNIEDYKIKKIVKAQNKLFKSIQDSTLKYNASETLLIDPKDAQYNMIAPITTESDLSEYYKKPNGDIAKRKATDIQASDIVLTKKMAEDVFGTNIESIIDSNGEAWVYSLAYPSDKANSLMAHRLRIIDGTGSRIFFTPITQKILRARDFDGDFITVWGGLTEKQKAIAKEQLKYVYRQYTLQENLYGFVKDLTKNKPNSKAIAAYEIASKLEVLEQSYILDSLIGRKAKAYENPTDTKTIADLNVKIEDQRFLLEQAINKAVDEYNKNGIEFISVKDAIDMIGMSDDTNPLTTYIKNPVLINSINLANGEPCYSYKYYYNNVLKKAADRNSIGDSMAGYFKKWKQFQDTGRTQITNPLKQLGLTDITLAGEVSGRLADVIAGGNTAINNYFNVITRYINKLTSDSDLQSTQFKNDMDVILQELKSLNKLIVEEQDAKVKEHMLYEATLLSLVGLETNIRGNEDFNNNMLNVLTKYPSDTSYEDAVNHRKEIQDIFHSKDNNRIIYGGNNKVSNLNSSIFLSKIQEDFLDDTHTKYVRSFNDLYKTGTCSVAVCLDDIDAEDQIIWNNNSNKKILKIFNRSVGLIDDKNTLKQNDLLTGEKLNDLFKLDLDEDKTYIIGKISRNSEGLIKRIQYADPHNAIDNIKVHALSKGVAIGRDDFPKDSNVDAIVSGAGFKNFDKYIQSVGVLDIDSEIKTFTVPGEQTPKRFKIVHNVPLHILIDDSEYDKTTTKNFEFMAVPANMDTINGISVFDSLLYETNDRGELFRDYSKMAPLLTNDRGTTFNWTTAVPAIQSIRANIIADAIDHFNMWEQMSSVIKNKKLLSKEAWLNDVSKNYEICTKEFNTMLTTLIKTIGIENFGQFLSKQSEERKVFFSQDIMKHLTRYIPSDMYAFEDNGKPIILKSKTKASEELRRYQSESPGETYNTTEKTLGVATRSAEDYYIPMSTLYDALKIYINNDDIFDATAKEILGFGKHHDSYLSKEFNPVNDIFKLEDNTNITDNVNNSNLKNGTDLDPTSKLYERVYGISYKEAGENAAYLKDMFGEITDPTLETALYDNLTENDYKYNYAKSKTMLGYMLYEIYNKNNHSNFDRLIGILNRNISKDIQLEVAKRIKTIQDGQITSTIHPIKALVDFNQLKSKELEELSTSLSSYGFYTFNDIKNNLDVVDKDKKDTTTAIDNIKANKETRQKAKEDYAKKLHKALGIEAIEENIIKDKNFDKGIAFTFDAKPTYSPFKDSLMSRSGIKITEADEMQADVIMKNYSGAVEMYKVDSMNKFNTLKSLVHSKHKQLFEDMCVYTMYKLSEKHNPEHAKAILDYVGISNIERYKQSTDTLYKNNPEIVRALNDFYESVKTLSAKASETTGEEFGNLMQILAPFVPANKELAKQSIYGNLKRVGVINSETNFNNYDPTLSEKTNMIFNFFDSAPMMIDQLSKVASMQEFSKGLKQYGLIDNTEVTDKVYEFLNENINVDALYTKKFNKEFYTIQDTVYGVVSNLTDLDIYSIVKKEKNPLDGLKKVYNILSSHAEDLRLAAAEDTGEVYSFSELYRLSQQHPENLIYKKAYDAMRAQLLCVQRLTEISPRIITNMEEYVRSLNKRGMTLCNKFGQKIAIDAPFKPIAEASLKYLSDNIELYANNSDPKKFAQYLIERAIRGELYIGNANMIDQYDKRVYTKEVPGKLKKLFQDISRASSSIQMALPAKLISRLLRFTGFDYIMGLTYNPKVAPEIIRAGKEISQAIYSKGESITEDSLLYQYLIREGQPIGQTGKDPVTFTEDINKSISSITDKLTSPLQYQNHLGRYAIWLAAYKSFEEGKPWYGPVYHHKDEIDAIESNYDKAMYVMDYMLGSPGGFPNVSKSLSGYLMYSTFPLNLTRTMGAYGMSLLTLAQEGITSENAPHWMRSVVAPSASLVVMNYLSSAIISAICDMYDIDEETEEEWKKEGVAIDPLGTAIGGTPSVVYDSMLPNKNLKEMFLNPLTSEYNTTLVDKGIGLLNSTVLSKLNPAIKTPIEVISRKDLFGSSPVETKHKYTFAENAMRKVLGFALGSGVSNSIIDQYKIDEYDTDSTFTSSLRKGFINGFSADLGNQKSWKKQTSNYYSVLDSIKDFKNANGEQYQSTFNSDEYYSSDYARINNTVRKMIHNKVDATTLYTYIISEYNNNGNIDTLRSVLNNNSIVRKLNTIDKKQYFSTLSEKELQKVLQAIQYEQSVYPFLETMFPYTSYSKYLPKKTNYYSGSGSYGGSSRYYPSTYKTYYPKVYYPSSSNYTSKYKSYNPNAKIDKVQVKVSPEMAVWSNDYNAIEDLDKREWYLDNPFYNNLSDYEKRQKGGN